MKRWTFFVGLLFMAGWGGAGIPVFEMPRYQFQHKQLQQQFVEAFRAGEVARMEEISRAGCRLLPEDPTWRYNLACALAHRIEKEPAFQALDEAIQLGFRNREQIEQDGDLKSLRGDPRFRLLMKKVDALNADPASTVSRAKPMIALLGESATVSSSNTVWNLDLSCFQSLFTFKRPLVKTASYAPGYGGPAAEKIREWLREGSASYNLGDLYINRDGGHSVMKVASFPGLTPIRYGTEAVRAGADRGIPNMLIAAPVIGNCSMSMVKGPYWRSMPRMIQSDPFSAGLSSQLFVNNQLWFYPEHRDFDPEKGDLYPANMPCYVISQGSSFSDLPFMEAFTASLAALRPETKQWILSRKLMGPTLQMLFRRSLRCVRNPGDYLTGLAHPVVFDCRELDPDAMVERAHSLKPEEVPPMVFLKVGKEDKPIPNRDFFDLRTEVLFDTPFCIARVFRGMERERTLQVKAFAVGEGAGRKVSYTWRLLQGDPSKVEITPLSGDGSAVRLRIAYHGSYLPEKGTRKTGRVDIGCFARVDGGSYWSMPSMVSLFSLPGEVRVYRDDGKIQSVDYPNPGHVYMDPGLSIQKNWKDLYEYDGQGRMIGWYRKRARGTTRFTWLGHKVLSVDRMGRPKTACTVSYLPRKGGPGNVLPDLSELPGNDVLNYTYQDERDRRGSVKQ